MDINNNLGSFFTELKQDLTAFISLKMKIYQLDLYEQSSKVFSFFIFFLIIVLIVFFAVLFLFLSLGVLLGSILNNTALGMSLVALLYVVLLLLLFAGRKKIQLKLTNLFLSEIDKDDKNKS